MKLINTLVTVIAIVTSQSLFAGDDPNDSDALQGVEKGKVVFDINMLEAKKMTLYLMVINQTVDDLKRQGVEPDVILAFRGKSVRLISRDREEMELTDYEHLDKIAAQLSDLQNKGVRMEACSVATKLFQIDNNTLLKGIKPVGNTFVSLTGYHAQGYASIPIY